MDNYLNGNLTTGTLFSIELLLEILEQVINISHRRYLVLLIGWWTVNSNSSACNNVLISRSMDYFLNMDYLSIIQDFLYSQLLES